MASSEHYRIAEEFRGFPPRPDATVEDLRQSFAALAARRFIPPPGLRFQPAKAGDIPVEWNIPHGTPGRQVIFYLHGGGFCMGSIDTHRGLIARLALAANARALSVGYRLAPECPYPTPRDDCVAAYRWLLQQSVSPQDIVFAGDSAGGGLVLSTLHALRDAGDLLPAAAVCMSPLTDLAKEGRSVLTRAHLDPLVTPQSSKANGDRYLAGLDPKTPGASPLYADQKGLPPTLVLVGTWEILYDDSIRWADRARAAGVDVDLEIWDEMMHVWPLFADEMPEARQAIERMGAYIRGRSHRAR